MARAQEIIIKGARTNNLRDLSLRIPHHKFIVVTGISGSGKSSLVFDIVAREGQRRYVETLPSFARQFLGKLSRPDVDEIEGLSPVIAIGQRTSGMHARSTVGTLSDTYDLLRLLFARTGTTERDIQPARALFSFNSASGKCLRCNGIGKEEQIDLDKLIAFPEKSIREGVLAPTLPNGYIMYSQVTIDVLNQVCEAEGFSVDIPWNELTDRQREVVLCGSEKVKVPFGKHSLESRLKWTGMKAKPREEGFYKGMIPIMSDILKRDRNANILKYVKSVTCSACHGARLNSDALSVKVQGLSIAEVGKMEVTALKSWLQRQPWKREAEEIVEKLIAQATVLEDLGLGHLTMDRPASTLRVSEIQRIRVANQLLVPLSDVLYVFDEPSIGLHREENKRMIAHFKRLVQRGNTVMVVEHDLDTIRHADHIIDIGPKAGAEGGTLLFNGSLERFLRQKDLSESLTWKALQPTTAPEKTSAPSSHADAITLKGCHERNLQHIGVSFQLGKLNVVSGRSGTGKASLVKGTLLRAMQQRLGLEVEGPLKLESHERLDKLNKLIFIDHSPIGKTPRSNPATYLGLSDHIRDIYARLPESKTAGFSKSRFSFNNKGGRCETCQGAGKIQIGMHFLGNVDLVCGTCNGDRFNQETLAITYRGKSIAEVYRLSVREALTFFEGESKVLAGLQLLNDIGLGYLTLGQSSTTLSGGEAQRIKIANQLQKKDTGDTLYIIVEPSIGLHHSDLQSLLGLFDRIRQKGNTIVCIEQNEEVIGWSDWHIELGPETGAAGGTILHQGPPAAHAKYLEVAVPKGNSLPTRHDEIQLRGVTTHGLKGFDVTIPKHQLTVVTGVSGSGKSSLVYDTLFAESNARFTESLSTYNRSFLQQNSEAEMTSFSGLGPAIGINRKGGAPSARSTVGTLSGVYDAFRLLFSRVAQHEGQSFTAQHFSFNHHLGACPECEGLGVQQTCDPEAVIAYPNRSVLEGAIVTNKTMAYYADPGGQFMSTLREVARQQHWDIDLPWEQLPNEVQEVILYGTGETVWESTWEFSTKSRSGTQELKARWLGLCNYINDQYQRTLHNKSTGDLMELMHTVECPVCNGSRLKPELLETRFLGQNIHEWMQQSIASSLALLKQAGKENDTVIQAISKAVLPSVIATLQTMTDLGLGYLQLDRSVTTLSGGERQRVTLAGQLSTHLFGVTYVLDEPTIGLDEAQVLVLAKTLKKLVANGNTVVVVEHDPTFIQQADYLIELGPGAGNLGGELVYQGSVEELDKAAHTATWKLLQASATRITKRAANQLHQAGESFGVKGAAANNLKQLDVAFGSKQIIAVTGVSGSGKSSLIKEVLYQSWLKGRPVHCDVVYGMEQFERMEFIGQEALSASRSVTPVSYTGILETLKAVFAKTPEAKAADLKKADFSYLSKNGKCPTCNGHGKLKTSMDFMSDLWLTCDRCQGMRYSDAVLACKMNGRSMGDVLQMTILEAMEFFGAKSLVYPQLEVLKRVGVGHLKLGQSGPTLSGGEAQRLKLATALMATERNRSDHEGGTLYLFDEPSTGLHLLDIQKLIEVFQSLVQAGDTVLFIEHHRALIDAANQVLTLGPGSGEKGGEVVV